MARIKNTRNETCLEYYKRLLSEGWKEIRRDGFNAILLSPEGVEKSVDLRNDVETLRPNAAGDETNITYQYPSTGYHWDKVDEVTADDGSTCVTTTDDTTYIRDLYNLPASTGSGTINKITVYARLYTTEDSPGANPAEPSIVEETPVLMSDGTYKNIETIKEGDKVMSYDLETKTPVVSKVVKTYHQVEKGYLVLNDTLKITSDHLIYSEGEFKRAGDIRLGDFLLDEKGQEVEVSSIEIKEPEVDTYDLGLDLQHNFFAGGYLVHNVTSNVAKIAIKSGSTIYESAEKSLSATSTWETISQEWATNPADSQPWDWSDIDALQIGVGLKASSGGYTRCTQVYVEVDYTPGGTPTVGTKYPLPSFKRS